MFQIKVVEKIKLHILFSMLFFQILCHFVDKVEKYGEARGVADGKMEARCMLDMQDYTHAHAKAHDPRHPYTHVSTHARTHTHTDKYNTFCFSTATMIRESVSRN
jgi:hypothetical protein